MQPPWLAHAVVLSVVHAGGVPEHVPSQKHSKDVWHMVCDVNELQGVAVPVQAEPLHVQPGISMHATWDDSKEHVGEPPSQTAVNLQPDA